MEPTLRVLSLGAGVQSTTLALMACDGTLPGLNAAIFADTGWEPKAVYEQVDRLDAELGRVGIPLYRVSNGNIHDDLLTPHQRYAAIPWHIILEKAHPDCPRCGGIGILYGAQPCTCRLGIGRRQCTANYKLSPIMRKCRELLGAKPPRFRNVPRGRSAEQWIGFSTDETHRVNDRRENLYTTKRFPLLDLNMSRKDCARWLNARGWGHTVKSACIGCPFHGNAMWRDMRANRPDEWLEAVEFDHLTRRGGVGRSIPLRGEAFLHRSRVPLELAPIDRVSRGEWKDRQLDLFEDGDPDGCSPYGCRSGDPVSL